MDRRRKAEQAKRLLQDAAGRAEMEMLADLGWSSNRVRRAYEQASQRVELSSRHLSQMLGEENIDRVFASALDAWRRSARSRSLRRAGVGVVVVSASSVVGPTAALLAAAATSVAALRALRAVPPDAVLSPARAGNLLSALHESAVLKELPLSALRRLPASLLVHPVVAADVTRALTGLDLEHRRLVLSLAEEFHGSILELCQATSALVADSTGSPAVAQRLSSTAVS